MTTRPTLVSELSPFVVFEKIGPQQNPHFSNQLFGGFLAFHAVLSRLTTPSRHLNNALQLINRKPRMSSQEEQFITSLQDFTPLVR